jgi:dihydrofolate reductase
MGITFVSQSVSVDGFSAGPDVSVADPMGVGGERLHDWMFAAGGDRDVAGEGIAPAGIDAEIARVMRERSGAVVIGRRMFDVGVGPWGDTPFPVATFVLTHERRPPLPMPSAAFTFVDDIEEAHRQAIDAAGDLDLLVMGGADVIRQFLRAGLVDEVHLQLVPVLLGGGTRLFTGLGEPRIELVTLDVTRSQHVTHVRYGIAK